MSQKPPRAKEVASGISGSALGSAGVFTFSVHLLDWISRGQTMMSLGQRWPAWMTSPLAQIVMLGSAVFLVVRATRLEHSREEAEVPRIIPAWSTPRPVKHKRRWARLLGATAIFAFLVPIVYSFAVPMRVAKIGVLSTLRLPTAPALPPARLALPTDDGKVKSAAHNPGEEGKELKTTVLFRGYSTDNGLRRANWEILTNKPVTPVTLLMECNREIVDARLMSAASRVAFAGNQQISDTRWELSMSSPVWSPTAPVDVMATYKGQDDIYCSFTVR